MHIANIITTCRILGSVLMLFFPVFTYEFLVLYLFGGFTDMIDGTIARKTNSTSEFGTILDTVADIIFVVVSLIKFVSILVIPVWLWICIVIITIVKISNIIFGFVFLKKFISLHTVMNKITGAILPLTLHSLQSNVQTFASALLWQNIPF